MRRLLHLRLAAKVGLAIVVIGLLVPISTFVWIERITGTPVDEKIALTPGHLERRFTLNHTAYYVMDIQSEKKLPFKTLQCLLGLHDWLSKPANCADTPAVLKFTWRLSSGGKTLQQGSNANMIGGM